MTMRNMTAGSVVTAVAGAVLGFGMLAAPQPDPYPWQGVLAAPAGPVCVEDEDCWDCASMGNRVCGSVDVQSARVAGWEARYGSGFSVTAR